MTSQDSDDKSKCELIREVLVYAPLGALGFIKDNLPLLLSLIVSRGKSETTEPQVQTNPKQDIDPDASFIQRKKPLLQPGFNDMTSDIRKAKDALYSVVGATGFIKKNSGIIKPIIDAQGKKDVDAKITSKVTSKVDKVKSIKPGSKTDTTKDTSSGATDSDIDDSSNSESNMFSQATALISSAISIPTSLVSNVWSSLKNG